MSTITLPENYGLLAPIFMGFVGLNFFNVYQVVSARQKYGIKYPNLYAPPGHKHEYEFNSVQRAHQNTLEFLPFQLISMSISGLQFPRVAALCGLLVLVGRCLYTLGYKSKGPEGRVLGFMINMAGFAPTVLMGAYVAFNVCPNPF